MFDILQLRQRICSTLLYQKIENLVLIYSVTRVDEGQQIEMKNHYSTEPFEWESWLHDTRLLLTQANLDWVLHIGKKMINNLGPYRHSIFHVQFGLTG